MYQMCHDLCVFCDKVPETHVTEGNSYHGSRFQRVQPIIVHSGRAWWRARAMAHPAQRQEGKCAQWCTSSSEALLLSLYLVLKEYCQLGTETFRTQHRTIL